MVERRSHPKNNRGITKSPNQPTKKNQPSGKQQTPTQRPHKTKTRKNTKPPLRTTSETTTFEKRPPGSPWGRIP